MRRSRYVAPQGENSVLSPPARKQAGLRAASPHPEPQLSAIGLQPWQKTVNMFMRSESLWTPLKGTPGLGVPGATEGSAGFCPPPPPPWLSAHENAPLEEPATRILGSHLTDPGSFPWLVSVKSWRSMLRTACSLAEEASAAPPRSALPLPGAVPRGEGAHAHAVQSERSHCSHSHCSGPASLW